jgi:probable phosphomutase (TIGR03848 family)
MRILLLRHAPTGETGKTLTGRLPGVSLSPAGIAMAEELADSLADTRLSAVYTSPIERCRETAALVGRRQGMRARVRSAFIEADYGSWSGRPLKSLYRLKAWQQLMAEPTRFRFPGGETLLEVQHRAVQGLQRLADEHRQNDMIAVCSHSDVIRVTLAHYLGMPLDLVHRLDVRPASTSIVDVHRGGRVAVPVINAPRQVVRR